jgi:flavin reductase (DIM6/NTAB) family NADH-FMN oxidoreductase RutF
MDADAKRRTLRRIPYALYVVTTAKEGEWRGFTATWITQVSFEPPLLALGIRKTSAAYDAISKSGVLVVHWLRKSQKEIAARFMKPVRGTEREFGGLAFHAGKTGVPVLEGMLAHAECRVVHVYEGGDHAVVIAEVIDVASASEGEALLVSDTPWQYGG